MKLFHIQLIALALQWGLLLWMNLRIEADPFIQLVVTPILLLLSLMVFSGRRQLPTSQ
ncbi:MAG: hypothetical protein KKF79_12145 [Gammaproteobacteria bacterium]|jgi:hypothetical protein|nr:hypothetical protein [Gammaproteobacteria bacterium]